MQENQQVSKWENKLQIARMLITEKASKQEISYWNAGKYQGKKACKQKSRK